ncbi:MAG: hypothetical protein RLY99_23 [Pseudomonadota bacterium]
MSSSSLGRFFIEYDDSMNIKKRLSLAQVKRQALITAGITPNAYGQKKATQVIKNRKKTLMTRGQKHRYGQTDR